MPLYYVVDNNEGGEDISVFVRSPDATSAIEHWRRYYWPDSDGPADAKPRVYLIPETGEGALPWHTKGGVEQV